MRITKRFLFAALAMLAFMIYGPPAEAQVSAGVRAGVYTELEDAFIGGELITRIAEDTYFNPNIEYVFADGLTYMTFNGDFHYDFPTRSSTFFWLGAGLAALYANPEGEGDNNTDMGVNLLGGLGFGQREVIPYIQGKLTLADNSEFSIGLGLRF